MKHNKARRIIARRGYAQKRIAALRLRLYKNAKAFYRGCDKMSAPDFDAEQLRISKKIKWYYEHQ